MLATTTYVDVEIDAPDGAAALDLEHRLAHLAPTAISRGTRWHVEVRDVVSPDELEVVVRDWLCDLGDPSTTMRVDGEEHVIPATTHRQRGWHAATNDDFIG